MYRLHLLAGVLLLSALSYAQQPATDQNAIPDTNANPRTYTQDTYNRPVEVRHGGGNWGLLGLIGLTGLFGRRRSETMVRGRDEFAADQRRRVA